MIDAHPDIEQLNDYILDPAHDNFSQLRRHLISCSHCRIRISKLEHMIRQLAATSPATSPASYPDVSAAHSEKNRQTKTFSNKITEFFRTVWSINTPAWSTALAMVFVAGFVFLSPSTNIAVYQDNQTMKFEINKTPGIAFFQQAQEFEQEYSGIHIERSDPGIRISWPKVEKATEYQIEIDKLENNRAVRVFTGSSKQTSLRIKDFKLQNQQRYTWKLSGTTTDRFGFSISGGFVVNE